MASPSTPAISKQQQSQTRAHSSASSLVREPVVGSVEYLERCRRARVEEQEIARQEDIRLQEILSFCEEYNRECDRFFRLEKALNRSAPRTPAKYLYARKDNVVLVNDQKAAKNSPSIAVSATEAGNNSQKQHAHQVLEHSLPQLCMQNRVTNNSRDASVSPNNANDREASVSPASTITEEHVNRKEKKLDCRSAGSSSRRLSPEGHEEEDEELKEFQALENEVNLTETIAKLDEHEIPSKQPNGRGLNGSCRNSIPRRHDNRNGGDSLILVPLAQPEVSSGSLGTPDGSEGTMTAASSQESDDKLTTTTAGTDFSSLILSIHSSMRKKKGKASSLPPNEVYSVSDASRSSLSRAFDTMSLKQNGRKRASSEHPVMTRSANGHGHASSGLIAEMKVLGHNLSAFTSEDMQITCCTCSGYLWKLCSGRKKWKRRFFHFDRFHKVFFYYKSADQFRKVKKPNGGVGFIELKDVAVDRQRSCIGSPLRTGSDPNLPNATGSSFTTSSVTNGSKKSSHRKPKYATLLRSKKPNQNPSQSSSNGTNNDNDSRSSSISSSPFKYVFNVETSNRQFILSTHSFELMRLWVDVIFTGVESYFD